MLMSLAIIYKNYNERNSPVYQAIDNFFTSTFENISNQIIVFLEPSEDNVIIYSGAQVRSYDIFEMHYSTRTIPNFYSQSQNLVSYYFDLMLSYAFIFGEFKDKIK